MSQIPSNINEIFGSVFATGLAYSNRYEVLMFYPAAFAGKDPTDARQIAIRCDSVAVPGRSFSTTPYRFYGPARNMPYEPIYSGELNMSVILSADLRERAFFETWMQIICSTDNYKFNYYDQYVTNMEIAVLDKSSQTTHRFIVEEVYPKSIGDLQMGYDKDNDFMRQDITMSFRKYTPVYVGIPAAPAVQLVGPPDPRIEATSYSRGGSIYKVAADGNTVNGRYDPQTANALRNNLPLP